MAAEKRNNRQRELDRITGDVAAFTISRIYADEGRAKELLTHAAQVLQEASKLLTWDRP